MHHFVRHHFRSIYNIIFCIWKSKDETWLTPLLDQTDTIVFIKLEYISHYWISRWTGWSSRIGRKVDFSRKQCPDEAYIDEWPCFIEYRRSAEEMRKIICASWYGALWIDKLWKFFFPSLINIIIILCHLPRRHRMHCSPSSSLVMPSPGLRGFILCTLIYLSIRHFQFQSNLMDAGPPLFFLVTLSSLHLLGYDDG